MSIKQRTKSLKARSADLSNTFFQLEVLNGKGPGETNHRSGFVPFEDKLLEAGTMNLRPDKVSILQVNIGKLCNQSCAHCHVDAGPDRTNELMSQEHLRKCLDILHSYNIPTVDITGGAPEMNPHFRWFVEECTKLGVQVINRCNLTIIVANKKYHDLPDFFAANNVHVISSLPFYNKSRTDAQRGDGVFDASIKALEMLNKVGYGKVGSDLKLDLVYNPSGAFLSAGQDILQPQFKRSLKQKHEIEFHNLIAINNLPISRFLDYLIESGNYESYMTKLVNAFNPATLNGLMCKTTLSISWDGYIYDCDFNQMLDLNIASHSNHLDNFDMEQLGQRMIVTNQHCYGCTAGAGSSCGGEIL